MRVAFAMTMNKSQGQSLERAASSFPVPSSATGSSMSPSHARGTPPAASKGVRVVAVEVEGAQGDLKGPDGEVFTRNAVYREALAG